MEATKDTGLQVNRAISAINELLPNLTAEDKALACEHLSISYRTLIRYVGEGTGKDAGLAVRILAFLRKRIEDRDKLIGLPK